MSENSLYTYVCTHLWYIKTVFRESGKHSSRDVKD
jgi:hypothetical protein